MRLLSLPFASGVKFTIIVMLNTSKVNNEQVKNGLKTG